MIGPHRAAQSKRKCHNDSSFEDPASQRLWGDTRNRSSRVIRTYAAGGNGRLAIPRGSAAELIVRVARDHDLILDLESLTVNGQRYAVRADADRVESRESVGANRRTGEFVGGAPFWGPL